MSGHQNLSTCSTVSRQKTQLTFHAISQLLQNFACPYMLGHLLSDKVEKIKELRCCLLYCTVDNVVNNSTIFDEKKIHTVLLENSFHLNKKLIDIFNPMSP